MVEFKHKALLINHSCNPVMVHEDFIPYLNLMFDKALLLGIKIYINDALRHVTDHISGAIVTPAKMSNHLVGFAIDCNLVVNGVWLNTPALVLNSSVSMELINYLNHNGMRWGNDFTPPDFVHFDFPLNISDPDKWHLIFNSINNK